MTPEASAEGPTPASPDPERFQAVDGKWNALRIGLDFEIPESITVAKGNAVCLQGWCYHPELHIRRLEILAGTDRHPVKVFGTVRWDVFSKNYPRVDAKGHSFRSGFWGIVSFPERHHKETVDFSVSATLENGQQSTRRFARTTLLPSITPGPLAPAAARPDRPWVAICMATCNPPLALFRRQVDSLFRQSYSNWICLISDDCSRPEIYAEICAIASADARFSVSQATRRLGFYRNFERCLSLVPEDAEFVALCDHDDFWHSDKLETLMAAFNPGTSLVYSDMRIVDSEGRLLSPTYWTTRANNYRNLTSLLIANTVTGAASMFRRALLGAVLPFPELPGEPYHDHWIACVALATGRIEYVDRPLYDYVQHARNIIGHFAPRGASWLRNARAALRNRAALEHTLALWRNIYFGDVLRVEVIAHLVEQRCGDAVPARMRRALRRLRRMDDTPISAVWLLLRGARRIWRGNETLGAETRFLRGLLWKYSSALRSRFGPGPRTHMTAATLPAGDATPKILDNVHVIRQKIAPLRLAVVRQAVRRVNLLIPTIDFAYVFGGYIAMFCLARKLADAGFRVRIVIVDQCDYRPAFWRQQLQSFQGIAAVLDACETTYAFDRATPVDVSPNDSFIATTWWTAHIARQAVRELGHREFLYLIQEFEPFTFPMGTFASLARATYDWPHRALFSTRFLQQYFLQERLGVFSGPDSDGESRSAVFDNAITDVGGVAANILRARKTRRLLFYARPEEHAARNMFELGILALCAAIEAGAFDRRWSFTGIGSVSAPARVALAGGRYMDILPRQPQTEYSKVLRAHDLGLSLMYTPHPSLVPVEMASAGMAVVTNTFANKTCDALRRISENILAVPPTIRDLAEALKVAAARAEEFEARAAGAAVNWPRDWDKAFNPEILNRVAEFLREISQ